MDTILLELAQLVVEAEQRVRVLDESTVDNLLWDDPEAQAVAIRLVKDEASRNAIAQISRAAVRQAIFDLLVSMDERRCFERDDVLQFALNGKILDSAEMLHDRFMEFLSDRR